MPGGAALARPVKSCHINGLALSPHCRVAASPYPAYKTRYIIGLALSPHCRVAASPYPAYKIRYIIGLALSPHCRVAASPYPAYKIRYINELHLTRRPVQAQRRRACCALVRRLTPCQKPQPRLLIAPRPTPVAPAGRF